MQIYAFTVPKEENIALAYMRPYTLRVWFCTFDEEEAIKHMSANTIVHRFELPEDVGEKQLDFDLMRRAVQDFSPGAYTYAATNQILELNCPKYSHHHILGDNKNTYIDELYANKVMETGGTVLFTTPYNLNPTYTLKKVKRAKRVGVNAVNIDGITLKQIASGIIVGYPDNKIKGKVKRAKTNLDKKVREYYESHLLLLALFDLRKNFIRFLEYSLEVYLESTAPKGLNCAVSISIHPKRAGQWIARRFKKTTGSTVEEYTRSIYSRGKHKRSGIREAGLRILPSLIYLNNMYNKYGLHPVEYLTTGSNKGEKQQIYKDLKPFWGIFKYIWEFARKKNKQGRLSFEGRGTGACKDVTLELRLYNETFYKTLQGIQLGGVKLGDTDAESRSNLDVPFGVEYRKLQRKKGGSNG